MSTYTTTTHTPLGELRLIGDGEALSAVQLPGLHRAQRAVDR